jgi:ankyrin repeat protein
VTVAVFGAAFTTDRRYCFVQQDGLTALIHASQMGRTDIVRVLFRAGADLDLQNEVSGYFTVVLYIVYIVSVYVYCCGC